MAMNILIIGAGAAGLNAGYFLTSQGFDNYQILEASDAIGGRIQALTDFVDDLDFDLGQVSVFIGEDALRGSLRYSEDIDTFNDDYELIDFDPNDYEFCQIDDDGRRRNRRAVAVQEEEILQGNKKKTNEKAATSSSEELEESLGELLERLLSWLRDLFSFAFPDAEEDEEEEDDDENDDEEEEEEEEDDDENDDEEDDDDDDENDAENQCFPDFIDEDISKFDGKTFFSYFDNFIIPFVEDKILLNTVVTSIDYSSSDKVVVTTSNNDQLEADRVIIATPSTVLRDEDIQFIPPLPDEYRSALNAVSLSSLVRVWLEFSDRFYPSGFLIAGEETDVLYFDAAFDQDTDRNILTVIHPFEADDEEIVEFLLNELDSIFDNQASASLLQSRVQNWPNKQFIKGAIPFLTEEADEGQVTEIFATPVDKIYFAGDYIDAEGHYYDPLDSGQTSAEQALNSLPL